MHQLFRVNMRLDRPHTLLTNQVVKRKIGFHMGPTRWRSLPLCPGVRLTNDISIEFEIRPKFAVQCWLKMYSTNHNKILHTSRQYILSWSTSNFGRNSNSIEIPLVGQVPGQSGGDFHRASHMKPNFPFNDLSKITFDRYGHQILNIHKRYPVKLYSQKHFKVEGVF